MPRKPSARAIGPAPAPSASEWVGARVVAPFQVKAEGGPRSPHVSMWLELPSGLVVATNVHEDDAGDDALARLLAHAMSEPAAGEPRVPSSIRVPTKADAARVLDVVPDGVAVRVAPTPEIDELVADMADHFAATGPQLGWLTDPAISRDALQEFFAAARVLYELKPWRTVGDTQVLRIDVPSLGVRAACLSVIGHLGEVEGILLFPSIEEFDAFLGEMLEAEGPEPPPGFFAGNLNLLFERVAELPSAVRRQLTRERWPLAGPKAFPYLERCKPEGGAAALTERDIRLASAVTAALSAFLARHRESFLLEGDDPVCETFGGVGGPSVTVTYPYESYEEFGDPASEAEGAPPVAARAPRPGRNDPCFCGSGKKYKKCHLLSDAPPSAAPEVPPEAEFLHGLDRRLIAELEAFARSRFGEKWLRHLRDFPTGQAPPTLAPHWAAYHFRVDDRPVSEWYEEARGHELSDVGLSWLAAQRAAWLSVWEVVHLIPGRSIKLADLLTGETRIVVEKSASTILTPRLRILARVVEHGDIAVLAGIHPQPLAPLAAEPVLEAARARARRRGLLPVARLRDESIGRLLIRKWEEQVAHVRREAAGPRVLHNTDGDQIALTVDTYDVEPPAMREVERRISAIPGVSEIEEPDEMERSAFTVGRAGRPGSGLENVTIARIGLREADATLEVAANSPARADEARTLLQPALRGLARWRGREHSKDDPFVATSPGRRDRAEASTDSGRSGAARPRGSSDVDPFAQDAIREFKVRHYGSWVDTALPALDGSTPREAARSSKLARRLELLLQDMESHERQLPAAEQYDFSQIRRELGLSRN